MFEEIKLKLLEQPESIEHILDTLGSEAEKMYERGWDMQDIIEREWFEKWLGQKADLLELLCYERGIKLWDEDMRTLVSEK